MLLTRKTTLAFLVFELFPLDIHIINSVRAITPKLYGRIYASTFHCYLYCESNFQLLDDKEYWTFIF